MKNSGINRTIRDKNYNHILIFFFGIAVILMIVHAYYYMPFISDDSFISLRYADRLIEGQGLTWTDGQPIEGYSNLLWILLVAAISLTGIDLIAGSRLLGLIFMAFALGSLVYYHTHNANRRWPALLIGMSFFIAAAPIAVWSIGGLEQPLIAAFLGWALVLSFEIFKDKRPNRFVWEASVPLALLVICRPDGCLFTVSIFISILIIYNMTRSGWLIGLRIILLPILFFLGQLVFRLFYYGEWIPNSARVKISGSLNHIKAGFIYLKSGFFSLVPFSILIPVVVLLLFFAHKKLPAGIKHRLIILIISGFIWSCYLIYIGGDIFPAWRHFVPIIIILALLLIEIFNWLLIRFENFRWELTILTTALVCLGLFIYLQFSNIENRRALKERWEWDGQVVGLMLNEGFKHKQPLLAVTAAGCLPYWSKLPSVDMLGLNDYYLPRHKPANYGAGWLGHELGSGDYILSREPDIIIFCRPAGSTGGCFRSGSELDDNPIFLENYSVSKFTGYRPYMFTSTIWIRRDSKKIGLQISDSILVVPCYLLSDKNSACIHLNDSNNFVIDILKDRPVMAGDFILHPGQWRIFSRPASEIDAIVRSSKDNSVLIQDKIPIDLNMQDTIPVNITLSIRDSASVEIQELLFQQAK